MGDYRASKDPQSVKDNETFQQAKITMVKAHLNYLTFAIFRERTCNIPDQILRSHLELIARIWAIESLLQDSGPVFDAGFFGKGATNLLRKSLAEAVAKLRPQLVPLAESFYAPDEWAPSVIGNSFGDIYELQLEMAKSSRLNEHEVPPYFNQLIKPIL
jgi:hypothetical protein